MTLLRLVAFYCFGLATGFIVGGTWSSMVSGGLPERVVDAIGVAVTLFVCAGFMSLVTAGVINHRENGRA